MGFRCAALVPGKVALASDTSTVDIQVPFGTKWAEINRNLILL